MGIYRAPLLVSSWLSDYGTLSSSSTTAASMPLSYLQLPQPKDKTRFTDVSGPFGFDLDLTAAKAITGLTAFRFIGLIANNSSATGTWTATTATSQANLTAAPAWSSTQNLWPCSGLEEWRLRVHSWLWIPAGRSENWLRITINDTSPWKADPDIIGNFLPATYFDIGRLVVGYGYIPGDGGGNGSGNRVGVQFGASDGVHEEVRRVISEGGQIYPRERPRPRSKSFTLKANGPAAEAEFLGWVEPLRRRRGVSRDVLLLEDTGATTFLMDRILYGLFGDLEELSLPDYNHLECRFTVQEMI